MKLKRTVLLALGVLIITSAFFAIGIEEISSIAGRMSLSGLVLLTALQLFTLLLTAYIWFFLLKQKSETVRLFPVFLISMAGVFVESVTPSVKIGGETMKIYLMKRETGLSYSELAAVAIVSKFYYFLPFLAISLVTLVLALSVMELPGSVYLAFAGVFLFTILFFVFFRIPGQGLSQPGNPCVQTPHSLPSGLHEALSCLAQGCRFYWRCCRRIAASCHGYKEACLSLPAGTGRLDILSGKGVSCLSHARV